MKTFEIRKISNGAKKMKRMKRMPYFEYISIFFILNPKAKVPQSSCYHCLRLGKIWAAVVPGSGFVAVECQAVECHWSGSRMAVEWQKRGTRITKEWQ